VGWVGRECGCRREGGKGEPEKKVGFGIGGKKKEFSQGEEGETVSSQEGKV